MARFMGFIPPDCAGGGPPLLLMSDRRIGEGEPNALPQVVRGLGREPVPEVGSRSNRRRPGGGTPVRRSLIGDGVGGVRSFERLLEISALGGGVVGPFVDGVSIVGGVVTVGAAGTVTGGGVCCCTGAAGIVDGPLSGRGSRVSPCELGAGSGHSCKAGGFITTSGRGGSGGAGRSGTGGRSVDKASSSIPIMNFASCKREARTETFFRVRRRSTSRAEFRCDAEEIVHRTS